MKLAPKLSVTLVLGVLLVVAAFAYPRIRREASLFESDMRHDHALMSIILSAVVSEVWAAEGEARALAVLDRANASKEGCNLRWFWFDEPATAKRGPWLVPEALAKLRRDKLSQFVAEQALPGAHEPYGEFMFTILPVKVSGRAGAIEITESLAPKAAHVRSSLYNLLLSSLVAALVCGTIAIAAGRWFVGRPVSRLIDKARRVGAGDLSGALVLKQRDELGQLAVEFNAMCDKLTEATSKLQGETQARIQALEQLRHAERLTTLGRFTSAIAHELGTPINVISGHAQLLAKGRPVTEAVQETANIVLEQCERMTRTVRQLLSYSRRREPKKSVIQASDVVNSVVAMLKPVSQKSGIELATLVESNAAIRVDPIQIQQALTNLLMNAIHASSAGSTVCVIVRANSHDVRSDVEISVRDEGSGISDEILPHIFEPFFTTKESGEGTGLGLSITKDIILEHGGTIMAASNSGAGSRFDILLPGAKSV